MLRSAAVLALGLALVLSDCVDRQNNVITLEDINDGTVAFRGGTE